MRSRDYEGRGSRQRLVMGRRRSRPKFFWLIFGPGGYCRRLYSAASTMRTTRSTSAELAPGQMDTDRLPPYEVLDALLDDYVEKDMGTAELIAAGHDPALVERVVRLVDTAEYKRRQYPPGPKISQKNFGRDRRLPITNRWREPRPS